jgi:phosphoribosylaminoimidazole carboxylase PurE protein
VIAAETPLPVIAVPIDSSPLKGLDALLAMVQMPRGIPVATVAIGAAGAVNAGILAAQIIALGDAQVATRLRQYKAELAAKVERDSEALQQQLRQERV